MATPRAAAALVLAASGAAAAQEIQAPAPAAETTAASLANPVETRFRLLPPTANPAFAGGPVPPPAGKNYGLALAEVIGIDALIWGIDYAMAQALREDQRRQHQPELQEGLDRGQRGGLHRRLRGRRHGRPARSARLNHCSANPRPISATVSPTVREADPAEPRRRFRSSEAEICSWFQGSLRLSPPRTVDQLSERLAVGWRSTQGSGRFRL